MITLEKQDIISLFAMRVKEKGRDAIHYMGHYILFTAAITDKLACCQINGDVG